MNAADRELKKVEIIEHLRLLKELSEMCKYFI
jgi:hypothetical protein